MGRQQTPQRTKSLEVACHYCHSHAEPRLIPTVDVVKLGIGLEGEQAVGVAGGLGIEAQDSLAQRAHRRGGKGTEAVRICGCTGGGWGTGLRVGTLPISSALTCDGQAADPLQSSSAGCLGASASPKKQP